MRLQQIEVQVGLERSLVRLLKISQHRYTNFERGSCFETIPKLNLSNAKKETI